MAHPVYPAGFGPAGFLRRTDSKDSSCSSLSSVPHTGREDLRNTVSVPAFHVSKKRVAVPGDRKSLANLSSHKFTLQEKFNKFRRTDSSESSNSSLASFGGLSAILTRNGSRSKKRAHSADKYHHGASGVQLVSHSPIDRADSGQSVISRGYTVPAGEVTVVTGKPKY